MRATDKMTLSYGLDSLVYTDYQPLASLPFKVYYYIPSTGNVRTMKILFAMHGADRHGLYQVETWKDVAEDRGVIVIAPQFDRDIYPPLLYQYGGVSSSTSSWRQRPREEWVYNEIESLFDYFKSRTGNTTEKYDLWGHSAGSQFSHRFAIHMPEARVDRIVCSNAGFYTVPVMEGINGDGVVWGYPYSVKGTNVTENQLRILFARNLTVHLGTADRATTQQQDSALPVDAGSKAQGACRFDRGHFFFESAKAEAARLGTPFNWTLVEVPGIAHSSRGMVQKTNTSASIILYYE